MHRVELVELEFPDGEIGHAEVSVPVGGDVIGGIRRFSVAELSPEILRISRWLINEVEQALPGKLQKVGLEFGLKLSAEGGPLVSALAKVGAEAMVVVKLEWNPSNGASS